MYTYILAILISTVAALLVQSIWFNPVVFGNQWLTLTKIKKASVSNVVKIGVFSSIVTAITRSLVILLLIILFIPSTEFEIVSLAIILWVGFVLSENIQLAVLTKMPKQVLYIYASCSFITVVAQSVVVWLVLQFLNAPLLS